MTSSKTVYKFDTERVVGLWLLPFFFFCCSVLIFYYKLSDYEKPITIIDVFTQVLFFVFSSGIFIFLFFNYLPSEKNKILTISNNELFLEDSSRVFSVKLDEIEKINEFNANRLPWGHLRKWEIITSKEKLILSSITISWLDFHRHFGNKIESHVSFFKLI